VERRNVAEMGDIDTARALLNRPCMMKLASVAISMAGIVAGCVTQAEDHDDPPIGSGSEETDDGNEQEPAPIASVVTIDWGMSEVVEIARRDTYLAIQTAVQLRLKGTFEAAGGSEIAIGVAVGRRNGHPISNYGWWSWPEPAINSDDYSNGSCGTWEALRTNRGLICRAPGAPTTRQTTTWSYAELEPFDLSTEGVGSYDFYVTAYDRANQELLCNRILFSISDPYGSPSTSYPACP
jgi:hypothetical protein